MNTGQIVQEFRGHTGWVWNLVYSPSVLLTCSIDHDVRVWDPTSGKTVAVLDKHRGEVAGLQADFRTNKFLTSGFDGKIFYWDLRNLGAPLMTITYDERFTRATFDENMIAAATFGQSVQLWDFTK